MSLFVVAPSQRRGNRSVRLVKSKPSVYLSFVREGNLAPLREGESGKRIWFRLHNNTRWSIRLKAYGLPEGYGEAGMFYDVVRENEILPESEHCHACSVIPLTSGKSLLFSIPREHLSEGKYIQVHFSFEWQDWDDVTSGREVDNLVAYFNSSLPKEAR